MKIIRGFGLVMVFSLGLAGNIFATGTVTATAGPGLMSFIVQQALSIFGGDACPTRQCGDCRPPNTEATDGNDGDGNCRPPQ